jgi:RNA polymerase sigma-70 factor (sigma-E family)
VEVLVKAETGFTGFVRAHTPALFRTAYLLTGNRASAEELVQDTLVRLYPKWDRVESAEQPLAYVRRCLTNRFINEKRRAVNREYPYEDVPERPDDRDVLGQLNDRDQIWAGLRGLPDRQRTALVLRFFEDLTDEQTAEALDCRVGTVRSLISRGLATLRERMSEPLPPAAGSVR